MLDKSNIMVYDADGFAKHFTQDVITVLSKECNISFSLSDFPQSKIWYMHGLELGYFCEKCVPWEAFKNLTTVKCECGKYFTKLTENDMRFILKNFQLLHKTHLEESSIENCNNTI